MSPASAQTLTTLYTFTGNDGAEPLAGLIADASGNLYGTTTSGGVNSEAGTVFKVTPTGTETVLYTFTGNDGAQPQAGLIADAAGNLYGTTCDGGIAWGTVFKLTPAGTVTVLYSFTGGSDGANPQANLIADASGNLYGTTYFGGPNNGGTVFKLTPTQSGPWTETVLYSFGNSNGDGARPQAGLIADAFGNLYGTTSLGGANGLGTVFELTPTQSGPWTETVLYSFGNSNGDGADPAAGLIADAYGNLYGTTPNGGANGWGTVFELTPTQSGPWTETVLYSFGNSNADGAQPQAGLIADASGNLYGTTFFGGGPDNVGTVFKLTPTQSGPWTETVLHSFNLNDGANPQAGLIADASGNLYGTTSSGGSTLLGTVFRLTLPATFNGVPGKPNCYGQSISFLAHEYGGIAHAASALGYSSVSDLQNAVAAYCGGY